ncbi:glyoxalase [Leptospira kobayashii]|uniref:Glyoxalase n=1 Tax=Leptospira kobayashii TaxID=1917830 RepID=A0ABM7UFM5_9LEPT|nr:VOC family protein [Leptospira kobayashii]BDA77378.1 glyoxalase [Leptospira kobayashii]
MSQLDVIEIKAFVPAKDYELSKQFYQDMGFNLKSEGGGVAYFQVGKSSFLLQNFYNREFAENLMMHLLVEDANAWFQKLSNNSLSEKYKIRITSPETQPWRMVDFIVADPSGVLWRIGNNI